jgi:tetratricopeptide (TPR) repeat protein
MSSLDTVTFSLVTTCKGRLAYLKDSLPTWARLHHGDFEIVVVDYDCPDGTADWVRRHRAHLLKRSGADAIQVVKVPDRPRFNLNDARNHGIAAARGTWIITIDSDVHVVDRSLLEWLDDQLRAGRHFVSNVQVLSSYYSEARAFFTHTFRVESFPALLLPFGTPAPAISGTACFAKAGWTQCGGYDPRVNEAGYGWDEYEFFLRYLNPAIGAEQRTDRSADATKTALDAGIRQTATFPLNAFRAIENQTEEKHRFYRDGHTTTLEGNKIFIRDFFATAATRIQQVADTAVTTLVFSDRSTSAAPRASWLHWWFPLWYGGALCHAGDWEAGTAWLGKVFDDRRSLPRGLGAWCRPLFEASAADRNRGRLSRLLQEMREIIAFAAIHPERGADAYCRLAEMAAEAHQPNAAEGFLRDAVALHPGHPLATPRLASLLWQRLAHTSTIDRQATLRDETMALLRSMTDRSPLTRYNRASLAKTLGQADEARAIFGSLSRHRQYGAGALFHLGDLALAEGRVRQAERYYQRCLTLQPQHRAAAQRLASIPPQRGSHPVHVAERARA